MPRLGERNESGLKIVQNLSDTTEISINTELISDENLEASELNISYT